MLNHLMTVGRNSEDQLSHIFIITDVLAPHKLKPNIQIRFKKKGSDKISGISDLNDVELKAAVHQLRQLGNKPFVEYLKQNEYSWREAEIEFMEIIIDCQAQTWGEYFIKRDPERLNDYPQNEFSFKQISQNWLEHLKQQQQLFNETGINPSDNEHFDFYTPGMVEWTKPVDLLTKNQVYRLSPAEFTATKKYYQDKDVVVVELDGEKMVSDDDILEEFIHKFKLGVVTKEEDANNCFPDYDLQDPLHGLAFAMDDLSNLSADLKKPIVVFYSGFYHGTIVTRGNILGVLMASILPEYDINQSSTIQLDGPSDEYTRLFNVFLEC